MTSYFYSDYYSELLRKFRKIKKPAELAIMTRTIEFIFTDIPVESNFTVFDKEDSVNTKDFRKIPPGNTSFEFTIPDDWNKPHYSLRIAGYHIPRSFMAINDDEYIIKFDGGDYYIDIRDKLEVERNQTSIETLIHKIHGHKELDGRQQFYISLVALESYFEHLVYGMLVLSGHCSDTQFDDIHSQYRRINNAFSEDNTDFFTDSITICPGKENLVDIMQNPQREEVKNIFNEIRRLRNKVVHGWGYRSIARDELQEIFSRMNESIDTTLDDKEFYQSLCAIFIRLYSRVNPIRNQVDLFNERFVVKKEREERLLILNARE